MLVTTATRLCAASLGRRDRGVLRSPIFFLHALILGFRSITGTSLLPGQQRECALAARPDGCATCSVRAIASRMLLAKPFPVCEDR
ncbi:hypothetical protein SS05631_c00260 [Sinorhizobium sp. CCBAU 05631]|nr:hypothetical protein SS05631_c00260 [Sinorhizobium sp. CCBAU 05631]